MAIKFGYICCALGMAIVMSLHEVKDQLSGVINRLIESGEEVEITKHGKVVAVLTAPPRSGVILGVAKRSDGCAPARFTPGRGQFKPANSVFDEREVAVGAAKL
jgi:antitoxin (DNA-binding transcriptional repressor) of toxin-antitoxin stability system